jgi:YegS/Rv2252/BmrU family lipid kinase
VIRVIFNPTARGDKARAFQETLGRLSLGSEVALHPTTGPSTAAAIATFAVEAGCSILAAAGGDGTVNEVLNGLASAKDGLQSTALAILPLGTVNVFAKELGIPSQLEAAWKVIQDGAERTVDLPFVDSINTGNSSRRYFAQMAGAGMDSVAIGRVRWELKKKAGQFAYLWACVETLGQRQPRVEFEINGTKQVAPLIGVGNGRFYGGRFPAFPKARLDDGLLDVTVIPRVNPITILRVLLALQRDRLADCSAALCLQTSELRLRASDGTPWHVEGDIAGDLPVSIGLRPRALRVVGPGGPKLKG